MRKASYTDPEHQLEKQESTFLYVLLGLFLLSLFYNLGYHPLMMEEPRRALIALEMLFQDNLLVPTEMGEYYYKKPPLYNWMIILSYQIFGYTEWAVRLWSVLSLIGMGILLFITGRAHANQRFGWYAAFGFVLSADLYLYFSWLGEIDVFYSFLCLAAFLSFFHYGEEKQWYQAFILAYFFYALGTLTKGLPSIVFAGLTTFSWLLIKKRLRLLFTPTPLCRPGCVRTDCRWIFPDLQPVQRFRALF